MNQQNKETLNLNKEKINNNLLPCNKCKKNSDNVVCFLLRRYILDSCSLFEDKEENSNFLTPPKFS